MKLFEAEWLAYRNSVIPQDAGSLQLGETRRAFYAGAWALYVMLLTVLEPGNEPTETDLELMATLVCEMREFGERAAKGLD